MEFGSIKNQVDPHCVFTRSETGPELRVAVLVAVKIEESTKTELLSISGPLIVSAGRRLHVGARMDCYEVSVMRVVN